MTNQPEFRTTSEAWQKYFGETAAVGLDHPNAQRFWEEINNQCLAEDAAKAIPSPLPVSEWNIFDCGLVEEGNSEYIAIDFQRHPDLPVEFFDCSLMAAFNAIPNNPDYIVFDEDHQPWVVHEYEEWTYEQGNEIVLRIVKNPLIDYLREYIQSDYEDAGRVILATFSMREDFNNYLSNIEA